MKAVIFDLDGVICSTDEYHYLAWKKLADDIEVPFDRSTNGRLRGVSRMESLNIILEKYEGKPFTDQEKAALAEKKNLIYREYLKKMSSADLTKEVKDTLDELRKRKYKLAIGSSSKNTPFILQQIGLGDYFDAVADGNCITHSKPDPEVFLKAAEMVGVASKECVVVEDAVSGAQAGKAAGMQVFCVGDAADRKAGDRNLEHFSEILNYLPGEDR